MIIVGELINASRKKIAPAIEARDADAIQQVAKAQEEAGADYIDVNAGVFVGKESDYLKWLVQTVQAVCTKPCCIDSPDPKAIEAALALHEGTPLINSISMEKERLETLLPVVAGSGARVVALCMSDDGMPETADQRIAIAEKLINTLVKNNVALEDIFVDPLVQPLSTNVSYGLEFMKAVEQIMTRFSGVHTVCGLSNISFGLPERKFLNQTFVTQAILRGLDGAIINPLDKRIMACIIAAEAMAGKDDYCMNFLTAYREKRFEF